MARQAETFETVIVGGGQAGLATGYHLARQGRSFVILDANERIGDPWRQRWDSLKLYSPAKYDGLPGMRFPAPRASFPTAHEMGDYLEAYASPLRASRALADSGRDAGEGRGPLRRLGGSADVRGGQRRRRDGRDAEAVRPELRAGARPAHQAAPFERLPEPLAATGRQRSRGRRQPLGSRHRLRSGRRARDHPVGTGHGSDTRRRSRRAVGAPASA